jgi:hypothetical protein
MPEPFFLPTLLIGLFGSDCRDLAIPVVTITFFASR